MRSKILPKVSIIIPCYNREKYIRQTIESVLSQTYKNIEIIAVDDGSTDATRDIIDDYIKKIKILQHPNRINKGQSAGINLGIRYSKGEYIAILDSDDMFAPEKIERQVKFLEEHPDVGLVYSNGFAIDENGKKLYSIYKKGHKETNDPSKVLLNCYFLVPNNSMVRRSELEKAGKFDESLRSAQDHDMAIRLAEVTKLAYIDDYLFYYRRHKDSISAKKAKLRWKNGFKILKKASKRYNYRLSVKRRRLAVLNFRLGQCFLEEGKYIRAGIKFALSGILDPFRSYMVLTKYEKVSGPH
jgi:glycosyltransferase involved in cell wall biosynthesis